MLKLKHQKSKSVYENATIPPKKIKIPPKFFFEISSEIVFYTENQYVEFLESSIKNLKSLFKISRQNSINYLQNSKYELCDTIQKIYAEKQKESQQNLLKNSENAILANIEEKKENAESVLCGICEEIKPQIAFYSLECAHAFCEECYRRYLKTSLETQGFLFLQNTSCPMENCKVCLIKNEIFNKNA